MFFLLNFFFLRMNNFHFWRIWFFNESFSIGSKIWSVIKSIINSLSALEIPPLSKTLSSIKKFSTFIGSSFFDFFKNVLYFLILLQFKLSTLFCSNSLLISFLLSLQLVFQSLYIFFRQIDLTFLFRGSIDNLFTIIKVIFSLWWGIGNCFILIHFSITFFFYFSIFFIILVIKKDIFFAYFLCLFFHVEPCPFMICKNWIFCLTPISTHKSLRASNCKFSELSEDSASTVRFLYNSVRKCFASVSFLAKKQLEGRKKWRWIKTVWTHSKYFCKELLEA